MAAHTVCCCKEKSTSTPNMWILSEAKHKIIGYLTFPFYHTFFLLSLLINSSLAVVALSQFHPTEPHLLLNSVKLHSTKWLLFRGARTGARMFGSTKLYEKPDNNRRTESRGKINVLSTISGVNWIAPVKLCAAVCFASPIHWEMQEIEKRIWHGEYQRNEERKKYEWRGGNVSMASNVNITVFVLWPANDELYSLQYHYPWNARSHFGL